MVQSGTSSVASMTSDRGEHAPDAMSIGGGSSQAPNHPTCPLPPPQGAFNTQVPLTQYGAFSAWNLSTSSQPFFPMGSTFPMQGPTYTFPVPQSSSIWSSSYSMAPTMPYTGAPIFTTYMSPPTTSYMQQPNSIVHFSSSSVPPIGPSEGALVPFHATPPPPTDLYQPAIPSYWSSAYNAFGRSPPTAFSMPSFGPVPAQRYTSYPSFPPPPPSYISPPSYMSPRMVSNGYPWQPPPAPTPPVPTYVPQQHTMNQFPQAPPPSYVSTYSYPSSPVYSRPFIPPPAVPAPTWVSYGMPSGTFISPAAAPPVPSLAPSYDYQTCYSKPLPAFGFTGPFYRPPPEGFGSQIHPSPGKMSDGEIERRRLPSDLIPEEIDGILPPPSPTI